MVSASTRGLMADRGWLAPENLALRQRLATLQRGSPWPRPRRWDRIFWVWLFRLWAGWRSVLALVRLETVVRWHRQGFRRYGQWKARADRAGGSSRGRPGAPPG